MSAFGLVAAVLCAAGKASATEWIKKQVIPDFTPGRQAGLVLNRKFGSMSNLVNCVAILANVGSVCISPAPSWRPVGAPSRRCCVSRGESTLAASAPFHRILKRAAWSSRAAAGHLLLLLIKVFVPAEAPVVIGFDDTIERRWGRRINARGIYRDPGPSSKGHFVKASGLRWLSTMLLMSLANIFAESLLSDRIPGTCVANAGTGRQSPACSRVRSTMSGHAENTATSPQTRPSAS